MVKVRKRLWSWLHGHEMKVQTSSLQHSSPLLSSPLSPSGLLHCWSALRFVFICQRETPVARSPHKTACLHQALVCTHSLCNHHISCSTLRMKHQRPREENRTPALSVSISSSYGFLLGYKEKCQEELFTISCLKYKHLTRADFYIC